jgi:DNA-binding response OmpR family regulator
LSAHSFDDAMNPSPSAADPSMSAVDPSLASAGTILVVEDEVLVRLAVAEFLRECGYRVFEAANVDEAKAVLDATPSVDVVFSDVNMPGAADGFTLATWIRARHPDVRVILTSGLTGSARRAKDLCEEAPLIEKPYDHETVLARVRELIRRRDDAKPG